MRFIVATYYDVFIADDTGRILEVLCTSPALIGHYGITWDEEFLYLTCSECTDPEDHQWIALLNHDLRVYTKKLYRQLVGTHDIICHDGWLWCCSTSRDQVVGWHKKTGAVEVWEPEEGRQGHGHLNSIWFGPDYVLLAFHFFGKGPRVCMYSWPERRLLETWPIDSSVGIHNAYMHQGKLITLCPGWISWGNDPYVIAGGLKNLHALAVTPDKVLVGGSNWIPNRVERQKDPAGCVNILDPDTLERIKLLPFGRGPVSTIRVLDEPDLAHHGMPWSGRYGA